MILVNHEHMNLPTLGGLASEYSEGHNLEQDIYVYGVNGGTAFYIDDQIPNAEAIVAYLNEKQITYKQGSETKRLRISVVLGLPTAPSQRPAIAVSKDFREKHIDICTRVCLFVAWTMHGKIKFSPVSKKHKFQPNTINSPDVTFVTPNAAPTLNDVWNWGNTSTTTWTTSG
jgi:hypothetical protein